MPLCERLACSGIPVFQSLFVRYTAFTLYIHSCIFNVVYRLESMYVCLCIFLYHILHDLIHDSFNVCANMGKWESWNKRLCESANRTVQIAICWHNIVFETWKLKEGVTSLTVAKLDGFNTKIFQVEFLVNDSPRGWVGWCEMRAVV